MRDQESGLARFARCFRVAPAIRRRRPAKLWRTGSQAHQSDRALTRLVASGLLVVATACGIPIQSEPELLTIEVEAPPSIEEPTLEDLTAVSMYLVRDEGLVHVTRDLSSSVDLEGVIASLLEGVTPPEERSSLRTSIPAGTKVWESTTEGSLLRLNLSGEFAAVGGEEELLAVAQIVLTATSFEGIESVAFELDGVPTDVPVASGALSQQPVTAEHYSELLDP